MYADVAVNRPTPTFTYHIPVELVDELRPGHLVEIAIRTARESGIVVDIHDHQPDFATKPVLHLLNQEPVVTAAQLELAHWLAENTLTALGQCLWLMLPPGLTQHGVTQYTLLDENYEPDEEDTYQRRVINLLKRRGPLNNRQFKRSFPRQSRWQMALRQLRKLGILKEEAILQPPRVRPKTIRTVRLAIPPVLISDIAPHLGKEAQRANILEVLHSAPDHRLSIAETMELADSSSRNAINYLLEKQDIVLESDSKTVRLNLPTESVRTRIIELRGGQVYLDILHVLAQEPDGVDIGEIYRQVEKASTRHLYRLEDDGLIVLGEEEAMRDPLEGETFARKVAPPLTEGQQQVWDVVRDYMEGIHWRGATPDPDSPHVFLIHGVTGSGKTEIYMRAVDQAMAQGRQSVVLVPEIALTVQLVKRFAERFKGQMSVIHSGLSPGERYDTWRRARAGEIDLIVGARSALFAPLPDVGLVVLDEEHDDSYKQGPPIMPPYYHAREVAIEAMRQNRGTVILGSATPDIQTWYRAERGDFVLLELPHRVLANREKIEQQTEHLNLETARYIPTEVEEAVSIDLPPVQVVDMRQELQAGNMSVFSRALKSALENVLNANEQALLFLNRRGTSTFVMCRDCGMIVKCKRCDTPLTYHADQGELTCHYCGHSQSNPAVCPACGSHKIKHFGTGTEKIDQALRNEFPGARVLRWDRDTSSERGAHNRILQTFTSRQADILVGTQMIAKGLDIPLVTLVGIISGDTALGLPDFRSSERTFQLLTQVAGRAGRGLLGGRVVLQTYHPQNYAIQAAAEHDYHRFYEREIIFRQMNQYPPYSRLARLLFTDSRRAVVEQEASTVAEVLRVRQKEENFSATEVVGPTPCFFIRLNNIFRWQILVRSSDPVAFLAGMEFSSRVMIDIDPVDLL